MTLQKWNSDNSKSVYSPDFFLFFKMPFFTSQPKPISHDQNQVNGAWCPVDLTVQNLVKKSYYRSVPEKRLIN